MSGNCVQRGDLAIFHKLARAEAAVRAGADLVIELPTPYVLGSAEPFAGGGVALLAALGLPDTRLAFGCESADGTALMETAKLLDAKETQEAIVREMANGLSYGAACQRALDTSGDLGALIQTPNNILAIEYLRAIRRLGADITPLPVKRQGAAHDSAVPEGEYASATYLRTLLRQGATADTWSYMPATAADIFRRELEAGRSSAGMEQLETTVLSLLRLQNPPDAGYLDDSEGLSNRIISAAREAGSYKDLLEQAKTKRYHLSRIRRLILSICLSLTPDDRPSTPPYIRPLAANKAGQTLLRRMSKTASFPILTRPGEVKRLGETARRIFAIECAVTDLQALCFEPISHRRGGSEWRERPRLIEG